MQSGTILPLKLNTKLLLRKVKFKKVSIANYGRIIEFACNILHLFLTELKNGTISCITLKMYTCRGNLIIYTDHLYTVAEIVEVHILANFLKYHVFSHL